jgi:glycine/D-amino acid oxidase-like deaminating enzyme
MLSDRGHSNLWWRTAPQAPPTPNLSADTRADVVVIGGGYTGLSTALHLAELGLDAVVLEAREIGHGGSGRNVGLVNAGMWVKPQDLVATMGGDWGARLIAALGGGPQLVFELIERFWIACEAERQGTLHLASDAAGYADIGAREAQWQALGAPVVRLGREAAAELTGTAAFQGGLLDRRAGTIQPLAYARGLAAAALSLGARVHAGSPVIAAERNGGRWLLRTPGGTVDAQWVVVATNAYGGLVPGAPFAAHGRELTMLPYFQFATTPLPADVARRILPQRHGCWDTRTVMTSFRMDREGRLVFGSVGSVDAMSMATQRAFAARSIRRLFPFVGPFELEHGWHGQIGMTADHLPKFHRLGENVIGVDGFNGRGIAPGTVFGRGMARLIARGEPMVLPESPIGTAPLGALMTMAYRAGSQLLHLAGARF